MDDPQSADETLESEVGAAATGETLESEASGAATAEGETAVKRTPIADLDRALEAILMVVDEPQSLVALAAAVDAPVKTVRTAIDRLVADYDGAGDAAGGTVRRGFELREVGGGWRIYVRAEHDAVVGDFVLTQNPTKLSQAALETLAVIAYRQPITRGAVASIRAVNVDSVVRTLLGRGLIAESHTDSETGAINYKTTDLLLVQLGINSIEELPLISPLLADGVDGFGDAR
ncbi:SMC-Scp complex subunit ScpB [Schumannella luteola]|uniref:Segregation and condensation protein B n=1 Tax=Schumannella luteola TaxID=472059 RepID=A0A852YCH1_9MICO|nr:SMC-Scp complex subunit ScpB [Schumannella luteola]NYH00224.1 segregation and condensation protein B [Schumannella luteola]TPX04028.1 SMC-Scp complex subunit ScpB [Schumannella luteola]